jgi:DNA-binding phage protein
MENNTIKISAATNRNIMLGILEKGSTKNAIAVKAGIPSTTFTRKLNSDGDFTLRELGKIAEALDRQLADILPSELLTTRRVA